MSSQCKHGSDFQKPLPEQADFYNEPKLTLTKAKNVFHIWDEIRNDFSHHDGTTTNAVVQILMSRNVDQKITR